MRYFLGLVGATIGALVMSLLASNTTASWVVRQFAFDSPDQVSDAHGAVYMGLNVLGLIVGWAIGFGIGAAIERSDKGDPEI